MQATSIHPLQRVAAVWSWALAAALWCGAAGWGAETANIVHDLTPLHDTQRVLENPHKGWYHHYPDNHIDDHGYAHEWLADNSELTGELLNRCGYWFFPLCIELPAEVTAGDRVPLALTLENRGVAPPYEPYALRVRLSREGASWTHTVATSDRSWLPGAPIPLRGELPLPDDLSPGRYDLAIGLFYVSESEERPVEFALTAEARDAAGYYRVAAISVGSTRP